VTNAQSETVTKLRASDGALLGTFFIGENAGSVVFDGANIWVTALGMSVSYVSELRASDGVNLGTFTVITPRAIAFDGSNIWISSQDTLIKIRASDRALLGTFPVSNAGNIAFDGANISGAVDSPFQTRRSRRYARRDYGRRSRPRSARGPASIASTFHNDALSIRTKTNV
jgi:hypothetical protein